MGKLVFKLSYPKAGINAPEGVKKEIKKFKSQKKSIINKEPLLYYLLGSGTQEYKMSKKDSNYIEESKKKNENCANCMFIFHKVYDGTFLCSQIRGEINTTAWCKLWKG